MAWSDDDRDKAIWWHLRTRSTCRECGTRAEEWDPAAGGNRHAYAAEVDVCRGCQQIAARRDALTEDEQGGGQFIALKSTRKEATRGRSS